MIIEENRLNNVLIEKTIENLKKNFFDVKYFNTEIEAIEYLKSIVSKNSIIGYGGSKTLEQINFFDHFNPVNYPNILDRRAKNLTYEQKWDLQLKALTSDFYFASANGLSQTGEIVMIDKWGNRNGAMTFGPKKRIFICGVNKITLTLEDAINRAKNRASVINNFRFETENPCMKAGKCVNCNSENRLCSVLTIISRSQPPDSILVILINKNLGF